MLPSRFRLKNEKKIKQAIKYGRSFFNSWFGIYFLRNKDRQTKIAIVVSTKIDKKAVCRNRIKRQIRHIFLKYCQNLLPGFNIVFITRPKLKDLDFWDLDYKLSGILKKIGLL